MIKTLNRNTVIITPKQSFFDMLECLSGEKMGKAPSPLDYDESTVYLLEETEMTEFNLKEDMEVCYKEIFLLEVEGWLLDDDRLPKDVSWEDFISYFTISYQSMVHDTAEVVIEYE